MKRFLIFGSMDNGVQVNMLIAEASTIESAQEHGDLRMLPIVDLDFSDYVQYDRVKILDVNDYMWYVKRNPNLQKQDGRAGEERPERYTWNSYIVQVTTCA